MNLPPIKAQERYYLFPNFPRLCLTNSFYQVGNNQHWSVGQWSDDISIAQDVGIDGFALNIVFPFDGALQATVQNAYKAAEATGFKLFFSFDYLGGAPWPQSSVVSVLNQYASSGAQFKVDGKSFASTFEGTGNKGDWDSIKGSVSGGVYFVPDWSSLGAKPFAAESSVDGGFSWNCWPNGASDMNDSDDVLWQSSLGSKSFMMGVSPWFYTNLASWGKKWVWRGDDLWHDRWQQVIKLQPQFVEIVTWNDFGEGHYIGPIHDEGIPAGAERYVKNFPHTAWLESLRYYIAAYKNGGSTTVNTEHVEYWYRPHSVSSGNPDGVVGNNPSFQQTVPVTKVLQDKVFVTAFLKSAADVAVYVGNNKIGESSFTSGGAQHFSAPFGSSTGAVKIVVSRGGQTVLSGEGLPIVAAPADGIANYNAWVGSVKGQDGGPPSVPTVPYTTLATRVSPAPTPAPTPTNTSTPKPPTTTKYNRYVPRTRKRPGPAAR